MNFFGYLKSILIQPFPLFGKKRSYQSAGSIGLFITFFFLAFKPLNLHLLHGWYLTIIAIGHGLVTGLVLSSLTFLLSTILVSVYREEIWKVYHQLLYYWFAVILVGLANWLLAYFMGRNHFSLLNVMFFTSMISIIPIFATMLLKNNLSLRKNLQQAQSLTQQLRQDDHLKNWSQIHSPMMLHLTGENAKEKFSLNPHHVLVIESVGNYVEIYWENKNNSLSKSLLRNTLQNIEEQLSENPAFFRCHRSFLVNVNRVKAVDGNSQGYLLVFPLMQQPIPVSRLKNKELRDRIAIA